MRHALLLPVLLVLILAGRPAAAAMLGDARVPFRADRTVTVDGHSYSGAIFHTPGHQRHEQDILGMHGFFLLDTGTATGDLVVPSIKSYVEFPFPALMAELDAPGLLRAPEGEETISGIRTTRYRIDHGAKDGSRAVGHVWVNRDGILMKLDVSVTRGHGGKPVAIGMELSHVVPGPQDAHLFTLPPGLTQLPPDALGLLLGVKGG